LSPSILIIPLSFLFFSPTTKLIFKEEKPYPTVKVKKSFAVPIYIIIFDELPTVSLLDEEGNIDSVRYPHFASFSKEAYWFPNATTVAESTHIAIPAILTGNYPTQVKPSTVQDYPNNLFTLLGKAYHLNVSETHTHLCPKEFNRALGKHSSDFQERFTTLLSDLSIVYLHLVLPSKWSEKIPAISQTWSHFLGGKKGKAKQKKSSPKDKPLLDYRHMMTPHVPWHRLPSGKKYDLAPTAFFPHGILPREIWNENKWEVIQGYQRHLLQVGYADYVLGILISNIKNNKDYNKSLIIVLADHGVSFWPQNGRRRPVNKTNFQDIMGVPLLIKLPNQSEGKISNQYVQTIDLVPTIADILKIKLPWISDGHSIFQSTPFLPKELLVYEQKRKELIKHSYLPKDLEAIKTSTKRKLEIFGSGKTKPKGLYHIGTYSNLIGKSLSNLNIKNGTLSITLKNPDYFKTINLSTDFLPSHLEGTIKDSSQETLHLAIAINGTIQAVTQTFKSRQKKTQFTAMISEEAFQNGENSVEIFIIKEKNKELLFYSTQNNLNKTYTLKENFIISPKGEKFSINFNAIGGKIEKITKRRSFIQFEGWAYDIKNNSPSQKILIFLNNRSIYTNIPNARTPKSILESIPSTVQKVGFKFPLPRNYFKESINLRFFSISKENITLELEYPDSYSYR